MRAAVASLSAPDLRGGARLPWMGSLVAMFLLLWEAPRQPLLVLLVPVACVAVILAVRSPAWPLGVITGGTLISLLAVRQSAQGRHGRGLHGVAPARPGRGDGPQRPRHPPLRLVLDFSAAGTIVLAVLMLARLPASGDYSYGLNKIELFLLIGVVPYIVGVVVGFVRGDLELFFRVYVAMAVAAALYNSYQLAAGTANQQFSDRYSLDASVDVIGLGRTMGEVSLILLFLLVRAETVRTACCSPSRSRPSPSRSSAPARAGR